MSFLVLLFLSHTDTYSGPYVAGRLLNLELGHVTVYAEILEVFKPSTLSCLWKSLKPDFVYHQSEFYTKLDEDFDDGIPPDT